MAKKHEDIPVYIRNIEDPRVKARAVELANELAYLRVKAALRRGRWEEMLRQEKDDGSADRPA